MDKEKNEKGNEVSIEKLEGEFHDFQIEWKKFLENDFSHLVANVNTLVEQNKTIQQNMGIMEQNILKALGARAHNWVGKKVPKRKA